MPTRIQLSEASDDLVQPDDAGGQGIPTDEGYTNANWAQQVLGGWDLPWTGALSNWCAMVELPGSMREPTESRQWTWWGKLSLHGGRLIRLYESFYRALLHRIPVYPHLAALKGVVERHRGQQSGWQLRDSKILTMRGLLRLPIFGWLR